MVRTVNMSTVFLGRSFQVDSTSSYTPCGYDLSMRFTWSIRAALAASFYE